MKFKKVLKYISFLFLIGGLCFLYGFSSRKNAGKKIKNVIIELEDKEVGFLTPMMVNKLLIQNGEEVQNQAKSVVNLYSLEKTISKNPYVEEVAVFLTIAGTLKSIIKQRKPIARIVNKDTSFYIDKQGIVVPLSKDYSARVLLVSGVDEKAEIKEILPLLTGVLEDDFLQKEIIGIKKLGNQEYQFSVRSGDYKIHFGKLTEIDVKFKKLKAFYNKAFKDKTIQKYKTINVKYHNQVVCTK